jgi:hypothetical protein
MTGRVRGLQRSAPIDERRDSMKTIGAIALFVCVVSAGAAVADEFRPLTPSPRSTFTFRRLEAAVFHEQKRVLIRGELFVDRGVSLHVQYRIDVRTMEYEAHATILAAKEPRPRIRTYNHDPLNHDWCFNQTAYVSSKDPAGWELAQTTNNLSWNWSPSTNATVIAGMYHGCWANRATPIGTTWDVNICAPKAPVGNSRQVIGEYINWDWLYDTESTHARHDVTITQYGNGSAIFWSADHWGESYYVLYGDIWSVATEDPQSCWGGSEDDDGDDDEDWCGTWPELCESPLVLDLNGDGIHTTGRANPVQFDLDNDGVAESIAWTNPRTEEAFLWLDSTPNGRVDGGSELFGIGMVLPDGTRAADGFAALGWFDRPEHGGNGDGALSAGDQVWGRLRLWIDRDHDAVADPREIMPPSAGGVESFSLAYEQGPSPDRFGNDHRLRGLYVKRYRTNGGEARVRQMLHDVFFRRVVQ